MAFVYARLGTILRTLTNLAIGNSSAGVSALPRTVLLWQCIVGARVACRSDPAPSDFAAEDVRQEEEY